MSWFNKRKNQSVIPPVQEPPSLGSNASTRAPSYRSENSYGASGGDDYLNRRTYADSHPSTFRQNSDGYGENNAAPTDTYRSRMGYGGGVQAAADPYARGERDIDADRNALFAGSAPPQENYGGPNRFSDGPEGRPPPPPGEEQEEDIEGIKAQTRFLKQDTVASTRNALRIASEAEETGRATLLKLGDQSGEPLSEYVNCGKCRWPNIADAMQSVSEIRSVTSTCRRVTVSAQRIIRMRSRSSTVQSSSLLSPSTKIRKGRPKK